MTKTELQNAADACALAAAYELTGSPIPEDNFLHAINAGKRVGSENRVGFQGGAISAGDIAVEFSPSLDGPWSGGGDDSRFVRCTIAEDEISPWFMQVLGFGEQTVSALAAATLQPAQTNCAIPVGLCSLGEEGEGDGFGLERGKWYEKGVFEAGDGSTGNFNWIDFSPPGGGQSELAELLTGSGQCDLSVSSQIGETGKMQGLEKGWNTRFGLYKGSASAEDAPPDWTGYAYTPLNWPSKQNALDDFLAKRAANAPYQGEAETGLKLNGYSDPLATPYQGKGADRRLVTVPIIPCEDWAKDQVVDLQGWACVLMLHPIAGDPGEKMYLEFIGMSNTPGSPCSTSGLPGSSTSAGPLVPSLVQ